MGIGPVSAIQNVLKISGLKKEDIDLFEVSFKSYFFFSINVLFVKLKTRLTKPLPLKLLPVLMYWVWT